MVVNEGGGDPSTFWFYSLEIVPGPLTDAEVAVGGDFTTINSVTRGHIAFLSANGSPLDLFSGNNSPLLAVNSIAVYTNLAQPSLIGKVVAGGSFEAIAGAEENNLVRLDLDGNIDTNFDIGLGPNGAINAVALQTDGSVVVGGAFTNFNGFNKAYLVRVAPSGFVDARFQSRCGPQQRRQGHRDSAGRTHHRWRRLFSRLWHVAQWDCPDEYRWHRGSVIFTGERS